MDIFGTRLRQIREKKGLTQEQLGKLLHVSGEAVSQWERGKRQPSDIRTIARLANVLDVSVDYLLGRTSIPEVAQERPVAAHQENDSAVDTEALNHLLENIVERVLERRRKKQDSDKNGGLI